MSQTLVLIAVTKDLVLTTLNELGGCAILPDIATLINERYGQGNTTKYERHGKVGKKLSELKVDGCVEYVPNGKRGLWKITQIGYDYMSGQLHVERCVKTN